MESSIEARASELKENASSAKEWFFEIMKMYREKTEEASSMSISQAKSFLDGEKKIALALFKMSPGTDSQEDWGNFILEAQSEGLFDSYGKKFVEEGGSKVDKAQEVEPYEADVHLNHYDSCSKCPITKGLLPREAAKTLEKCIFSEGQFIQATFGYNFSLGTTLKRGGRVYQKMKNDYNSGRDDICDVIDIIRGKYVCKSGDELLKVIEAFHKMDEDTKGDCTLLRLKNSFLASGEECYPKITCNFRIKNKFLLEVQVVYDDCLKTAVLDHFAYEVKRVTDRKELFAQYEGDYKNQVDRDCNIF